MCVHYMVHMSVNCTSQWQTNNPAFVLNVLYTVGLKAAHVLLRHLLAMCTSGRTELPLSCAYFNQHTNAHTSDMLTHMYHVLTGWKQKFHAYGLQKRLCTCVAGLSMWAECSRSESWMRPIFHVWRQLVMLVFSRFRGDPGRCACSLVWLEFLKPTMSQLKSKRRFHNYLISSPSGDASVWEAVVRWGCTCGQTGV